MLRASKDAVKCRRIDRPPAGVCLCSQWRRLAIGGAYSTVYTRVLVLQSMNMCLSSSRALTVEGSSDTEEKRQNEQKSLKEKR